MATKSRKYSLEEMADDAKRKCVARFTDVHEVSACMTGVDKMKGSIRTLSWQRILSGKKGRRR